MRQLSAWLIVPALVGGAVGLAAASRGLAPVGLGAVAPDGRAVGAPVEGDRQWAPGSLLVRVAPGGDLDAALARAGVKGPALPLGLVPGLHRVDVPPAELAAALASLSNDPALLYAERNPVCRAAGGQALPDGVAQVRAPSAWAQARGTGVRVAVLDTGIDLAHPDLPAPVDSVSFIAGEPVQDGNRHGTHVAGIIAGLDNAVGVIGVAPACDLLVAKVLANSGAGTVDGVILGLGWAVERGARVVNMSLSGAGYSRAFADACDAATAAGALLVAAAGNDASDVPAYPASYPAVVSVAAVDGALSPAGFSNFGPSVSVAAPGVGVVSTIPVVAPTVFLASQFVRDGEPRDSAALSGSALGEVAGAAVWCGYGGSGADFPPSVVGRVAVVRRGGQSVTGVPLSFRMKATAALAAGASALVIANNAPGLATGTLGGPVGLPVLTVSKAEGDALEAAAGATGGVGGVGSATVVVRVTGPVPSSPYGAISGTSMAAPHVSGVAALLIAGWGDRLPVPAPADLRRAIQESATDLGQPGRDDRTGAGLVNAAAAIDRLAAILTPVCSPADIADTAGTPARDGQLDNGDFLVFFRAFFAGCDALPPAACSPGDIAASDGTPGPDGELNGGDFQLFFYEFFNSPCPG